MSEQEALDAMHAVAPREWWRFVGCRTCNARRGEECMTTGLDRRGEPHAARYRAGLMVHGVLWLLRNFPDDLTTRLTTEAPKPPIRELAARVAPEGETA